MQIPLTPSQAARQLNVSMPTIYKWVEAKKLEATVVRSGETTRIYISREAVDLKQAELEAAAMEWQERPPTPKEEHEWTEQYRNLIGRWPPFFGAYQKQKVTFEQMKAEARRRFEILF